MKTRVLLLLLGLAVPAARAQYAVPVIDYSVLFQTIEEVAVATKQLMEAREELRRLGDPGTILPDRAGALLGSLAQTGVGKTLDELQEVAQGAAALAYEAHGLYRAPGEAVRRADGTLVARAAEHYRKFDAVTQVRAQLEVVLADTERRRQSLRRQIQVTVNRLSGASTTAEVDKLQGLLVAQQSELAAVDRERDAAAQRVVAQDIENRTDAARQEEARREEHLAAFRQAQARLNELLTPETGLVTIPDPHR